MSAFRSKGCFGLVTATAVVAGLFLGTLAVAGKPGGGGGGGSTPTGTIFFDWGSDTGSGAPPYEYRGFWMMQADGSGKQLTFGPANMSDLSHFSHQGHAWYLAWGVSPTHEASSALFAVRDDGDPDSTVVLIDLLDWAPAHWAKDDSFVAWMTLNNAGLEEIWAADVSFDADTGVPFLTTVPVPVVQDAPGSVADFEFSPLGDEVVYQADNRLLIKDLLTGTTRSLYDNLYGLAPPRWSPNGTRIAFKLEAGIHMINPDGSNLVQLSAATWGDSIGDWSPDSAHIIFTRLLRKGANSVLSADVMRVTVSNGNTVNLTKEIDGTARAEFWR